ncbi:hypothetical protein TNCV_343621 [Trichonephila clavipes]|nr:hypothetical protein TNCV_343621 [Trichonephila clavipes]
MAEMNEGCEDAFERIDVLPFSNCCPDESRGYQQCLPNYSSANVDASGSLKRMTGSCTYDVCCSSATKAGILSQVSSGQATNPQPHCKYKKRGWRSFETSDKSQRPLNFKVILPDWIFETALGFDQTGP